MPPVQNHGFKWENDIKENVFEINTKYQHTSIFDIYSKDNKYNRNENVSVKSSSSDTINCSDILRFYDYKDYELEEIITECIVGAFSFYEENI